MKTYIIIQWSDLSETMQNSLIKILLEGEQLWWNSLPTEKFLSIREIHNLKRIAFLNCIPHRKIIAKIICRDTYQTLYTCHGDDIQVTLEQVDKEILRQYYQMQNQKSNLLIIRQYALN